MRHRAAPSRRQLRRRRLNRRQRAVSLLLLVGLAAGAAIPCVMLQPWTAAAQTHARFDRSTALTRADLVETSRGVEREAGMWTLGESDEPSDSLTVRAANNPVVKALINGRDANTLPDGFNPDHATGDGGDDYPYGQCTWWAYERRKQLGLPVGGRSAMAASGRIRRAHWASGWIAPRGPATWPCSRRECSAPAARTGMSRSWRRSAGTGRSPSAKRTWAAGSDRSGGRFPAQTPYCWKYIHY